MSNHTKLVSSNPFNSKAVQLLLTGKTLEL